MLLQLVYEDQWVIPVPVDARVHEALDVQRERALRCEMDEVFTYQLSVCVANSLAAFLDPDLQLPTANQVKYTTDIARQLGISIPADALRYRGAAHEFIERFEEPFKVSRKLHITTPDPTKT